MSNRTIRRHLNAHIDRVAAILGCVAHSYVTSSPTGEPNDITSFVILAAGMRPFRISPRSPYWLTVIQRVSVRPEPVVEHSPADIVGYSYRIGYGTEGTRELLAYHLDPFNPESGTAAPHLHIGRSTYRPLGASSLQDFHKRHIPTGHVTFPMVVRFLIEELGVEPINPNWDRILSEANLS